MPIDDNKKRVRRLFDEVVSRGKQEAVYELLADSCRYFDAGKLKTNGCDEFAAYLAVARKPFDSINVQIDNLIAEGEYVAARCSYHLVLEG